MNTGIKGFLSMALALCVLTLGAQSAGAAMTENGKTWYILAHPHFDRVMTPWMVKRFIDKNAKFAFAAKIEDVPKDAMALGFPTGEFRAHDEHASTFKRVLDKYKIEDPALLAMDRINEAGVNWFLYGKPIDLNDRYARMAYGLLGLADAMSIKEVSKTDQEILDRGFPNFDALYTMIQAELRCPASTPKPKYPGVQPRC